MKKFKYLNNISKYSVFVLSLIMALASCDNEFNDPEPLHNTNTEPPVITSVAEARENLPVTEGVLENLYYIKGENLASVKSIKYNGYEAGYNPVYVTDNLIISSIPEEAPFIGTNILRLETVYGVAEYDFSLLTITDFSEATIDGESVVIINGGDFSNVEKVTFVSGTEELGNLVEKPATIKEELSDKEKIVAVVPDGVVQAFIYVETTSGAVAVSESYGFNYAIFVDAINPDWNFDGWSGGMLSESPALGQYSMRADIEGWGGFSIATNGEEKSLGANPANYERIIFKVYATAPDMSLVFRVNDGEVHWEGDQAIDITLPGWELGDWTEIEIPLSDLYQPGSFPSTIWRIDFQIEQGTFYIDDMGFL